MSRSVDEFCFGVLSFLSSDEGKVMLRDVVRIALLQAPPAKGLTHASVGADTSFVDLEFGELDIDAFFQAIEEMDGPVKPISTEERAGLTTLGAVAEFLTARN